MTSYRQLKTNAAILFLPFIFDDPIQWTISSVKLIEIVPSIHIGSQI